MKNEGFKNVFLFSCDDKRECRKKTQNSAPKNSLFVNMFFIFDRDAEIVLFWLSSSCETTLKIHKLIKIQERYPRKFQLPHFFSSWVQWISYFSSLIFDEKEL